MEEVAGLPPDAPLLLGSPPISHEYYDPAEFMEGGPQEADRMDELEYEVRRVASPGIAVGLPAQAWLPLPPGGQTSRSCPVRGFLLGPKGQVGLSRGGHA